MGRTRSVIFYKGTTEDDNKVFFGDYEWGDICFVLFYASKLDPEKAKVLLRLIFGNTVCELTYHLPRTSVGEDTQFITQIYNADLLMKGIDFLQNTMFPTLMKESLTYEAIISQKFGGVDVLEERINKGEEKITNLIGCLNQYFEDDTEMLAHFCFLLGDFFKAVLDSKVNYRIELN